VEEDSSVEQVRQAAEDPTQTPEGMIDRWPNHALRPPGQAASLLVQFLVGRNQTNLGGKERLFHQSSSIADESLACQSSIGKAARMKISRYPHHERSAQHQ